LYRGEEVVRHQAVKDRIQREPGNVFGHEFSGVVEEVENEVTSISPGTRVFAPGPVSCGSCAYCAQGNPELCAERGIIGMDRPGALSEYIVLPASEVAEVPDALSAAEGAVLQPLASAVIDVFDAGVTTGDVVLVIGTGIMGNHCGQVARSQGAKAVFAVDVRPDVIEIAEQQGMYGIDATVEDHLAPVAEATHDQGPDVVFEAVGGQQESVTDGDGPLTQAISVVRGGTVSQGGIIPGEPTVNPLTLNNKAVTWEHGRDQAGCLQTGPNGDTVSTAVELVVDGRVSVDEFITHEVSGLESVEDAIDITLNKDSHGALRPAQIDL
jgi:threonine dehydrogenase-like Zn-dependent dehydrogenase